MSPLWSDSALAQAAWDNAVDRGLVDRDPSRHPKPELNGSVKRELPRRPIRRPVSSFAL